MTLNTTDSKIAYAGDGSTTVFAMPFKFLDNGDIEAVLRDDATGDETIWTENTEFALSGAGIEAGGTLTVATSPTNYTPPSGTTLVIRRVTAETQGAAFPAGGAFPSVTIEKGLDRLTMLVQQHSEIVARALLAPTTDPPSSMDTLPASVARASKYLGFDGDGVPVALEAPAGTTAVSAFMTTVLLAASAAAARAAVEIDGASKKIESGDIADGGVVARLLAASALGSNMINGTLVATVAANALTVSIKTKAGTDPSAADPVLVLFRNGTPATGDYTVLSLTSATSFVVSSGSTLGTTRARF